MSSLRSDASDINCCATWSCRLSRVYWGGRRGLEREREGERREESRGRISKRGKKGRRKRRGREKEIGEEEGKKKCRFLSQSGVHRIWWN